VRWCWERRHDPFEQLRRSEAEQAIAALEAARRRAYVPSATLAGAHASVGHRATALDWLEAAVTERDVELTKLGCSSEFDRLRGDPRFEAVVRTVGLPPEAFGPVNRRVTIGAR
jgi:hypothetical protein